MNSKKKNNQELWKEITTEDDIKYFLSIFNFHDSCLKELYLWTDHYVDSDLRMAISELDFKVRILFQRQGTSPSAIELLFEEVTGIHINPSPANCDSILFGATILLINGVYYWANEMDWNLEDQHNKNVSWISSFKLKWRDASDWMGPNSRYGQNL